MSEAKVDSGRRTWIAITCGAGAVGGAAVAVPFVASFAPSERAKAAGAPVQADISALRPGEKMTVEWRGKPVWIVRRTAEQVAGLDKLDGQLADPNSERTAFPTPDYARNEARARLKKIAEVDTRDALGVLPLLSVIDRQYAPAHELLD